MSKEIPRQTFTVPAGATAEVIGDPISLNEGVYQGQLTLLKVVVPNFTAAATITIKLYDRNDLLKYTSSAISKNTGAAGSAVLLTTPVPLFYGEYFSVTPSIDPVSSGSVTIDAEYTPDARVTVRSV